MTFYPLCCFTFFIHFFMSINRSLLAGFCSLLILGAGCSSAQQKDVPVIPEPSSVVTSEPSTSTTIMPEPSVVPTKAPVDGSKPTAPVTGAPIEYKDLGVDVANSKYGNFQVKILTDKKISSVEVAFEGTDANGQVTRSSTYTWQNIVNGEQKLIEKGKTYQDHFVVGAGTVKIKSSVKYVNFEDGTNWSP